MSCKLSPLSEQWVPLLPGWSQTQWHTPWSAMWRKTIGIRDTAVLLPGTVLHKVSCKAWCKVLNWLSWYDKLHMKFWFINIKIIVGQMGQLIGRNCLHILWLNQLYGQIEMDFLPLYLPGIVVELDRNDLLSHSAHKIESSRHNDNNFLQSHYNFRLLNKINLSLFCRH